MEPEVPVLVAGGSGLSTSLFLAWHGVPALVVELESGVRWERLTALSDPDVEFIYAVYKAGSASSRADSLLRHNGREFGVVLSGRLGVTVGFDEYLLGPGQSITFDAATPHRLHNDGDEDATVIWVVLGRHRPPEDRAGSPK